MLQGSKPRQAAQALDGIKVDLEAASITAILRDSKILGRVILAPRVVHRLPWPRGDAPHPRVLCGLGSVASRAFFSGGVVRCRSYFNIDNIDNKVWERDRQSLTDGQQPLQDACLVSGPSRQQTVTARHDRTGHVQTHYRAGQALVDTIMTVVR